MYLFIYCCCLSLQYTQTYTHTHNEIVTHSSVAHMPLNVLQSFVCVCETQNRQNRLLAGEVDTQEMANKDHDEKVRQFLNRCEEKNIRLNADKSTGCAIHRTLADIQWTLIRSEQWDTPRPTDIKGIQRLVVVMVNYLSKTIIRWLRDTEAA